MAKKMIRKFLLISAVLLMLSSQSNADYCGDEYNACWNAAVDFYSWCVNMNPCYNYCMQYCTGFNPESYCNYYCNNQCGDPTTPCLNAAYDMLDECEDEYNACMGN